MHASGQVASVRAEGGPPAERAAGALNAALPDDVAVVLAEEVEDGFSARFSARSRAYRYRLLRRRMRSPFEARRALWWPKPLDRDALDAAAALLPGTHDFTAFTPTETEHTLFERTVLAAAWEEHGDELHLTIEAVGFLRHMVRILVGSMLEGLRSGAVARGASPQRSRQDRPAVGALPGARALLAQHLNSRRRGRSRRYMVARSLARSRLPVIATGVLSALMIALYFLADAGTTAQTLCYEGVGVLALVACVGGILIHRPERPAYLWWLATGICFHLAGDAVLVVYHDVLATDRAVSVDRRPRVPGRVRLAHRRDDAARSTSRAARVERRPRWPDRPGRIGAALLVHARGAGDARDAGSHAS